MRIVSFLPAATEMVCALGLADQLVGVTEECDHPPEVKNKPVVVRSVVRTQELTLSEIDEAVSARLRNGQSLYEVDEKLLQQLVPDVILTQNLCQVCAPSGNEITTLLASLSQKPRILWLTPKSLSQIFDNLREVGQVAATASLAEAITRSSQLRLQKIASITERLNRPRVFFMEWVDPIYCGGHWIPEMIELAGGIDSLSRKGADSVRVTWDEVMAWRPEVIIISPCGFKLSNTIRQIPLLCAKPHWFDLPAVCEGRVYAVDANAYFARPGPRVVEGTELLTHLIHPDNFDWVGHENAFQRFTFNDAPKGKKWRYSNET